MKGAAALVADGISSSPVSHLASQAVARGFLEDYFCTPEAWTVERAATAVLQSLNSWLDAQSRQTCVTGERDRGYVCTVSAVVLKGNNAHLFHVGDSRIYRLRGTSLELLTTDHRASGPEGGSYLSRALGAGPQVEIDYRSERLQAGDLFLVATDGVYEHIAPAALIEALREPRAVLEEVAQGIVEQALAAGSTDNLTLQLLRVDALQDAGSPLFEDVEELPFPPELAAGLEVDGYRIVRPIHISARSHCYLAVDVESGEQVVLKTPSVELRGDQAYLERFLLEEWVARRLNNPHVVHAPERRRPRTAFYTVTAFVEGQTLAQWLVDNPRPELPVVRGIAEQIARGLLAFHRMDMLHQDIRPENLMIDGDGTLKIIDFGSVRILGIEESGSGLVQPALLGTAMYSAPEYFLGEPGTAQSDLYSLAVIVYHMLSGNFPYGPNVAKAHTLTAQRRLHYRSVLDDEREIPRWIDATLKKALQAEPERRYTELSEFLHDLKQPGANYLAETRPPLMERNPVLFWQCLCLLLLLVVIYQAAQ